MWLGHVCSCLGVHDAAQCNHIYVGARVTGCQYTYKLIRFGPGGQNEVAQIRGVFVFSHPKFWCEKVPVKAPQAPLAKMVALLGRLAATDGDGFTIFGSHLQSSNPLIEICLLVPFPPQST